MANKFYSDNFEENMDLNKKNFFKEVIAMLEEIELQYEDHEFDIDESALDEESEEFEMEDALVRFMTHVREAKEIADANN